MRMPFRLIPLFLLAGCTPPQALAAPAPPPLAGPMTVRVDARDAAQMVLHAKVRVPARPGPLTLVYPKWIPGHHGPAGRVADISGLRFSAGGQTLAWRRDPVETSEFSVIVPAGAAAVDVELDVVADPRWFPTDGVSSIGWEQVVLYPKGARVRDVRVEPSAQMPSGWRYATSLQIASDTAGAVNFRPTTLEMLVDSPVILGRYGRSIDLGTALGAAHSLEVVAESKDALQATEARLATYRRLVAEAAALFGARHYDRYTFLLTLSSSAGEDFNGTEHHASSQNVAIANFFTSDDAGRYVRWLLPHEFAHSWCGKYRRPKGLATPDYQQPMRNDLLWVYEGLTHYLGWLLSARSGVVSTQDALDDLARMAAELDAIPGRKWRPLGDTTFTAAFGADSNRPWYSAQRAFDYYPESLLVWLEADTLIRQKTDGKRSLDDFLRAFFGGANTGAEVKPYELADVLKALGDVVAYDWKSFFEQRITAITPHVPLGGVEAGGYKLGYHDKPSDFQSVWERSTHLLNERSTLGVVLDDKGVVKDVHLDGPAGKAGLPPGGVVVAVNGRKYSPDVLRRALADAAKGPVELLAERDGFFRTYRVAGGTGARYPHLDRDPAKPDLLGAILAPRAPQPPPAALTR
ncbi:PDZ domain-containing protein [Pendulispora rubella]|uniref:PDZ domain-containing protein n=1 Tax=Pendulispora rubella TaxID=2741070 RepID=A0ABZ2LFX1_9BACT